MSSNQICIESKTHAEILSEDKVRLHVFANIVWDQPDLTEKNSINIYINDLLLGNFLSDTSGKFDQEVVLDAHQIGNRINIQLIDTETKVSSRIKSIFLDFKGQKKKVSEGNQYMTQRDKEVRKEIESFLDNYKPKISSINESYLLDNIVYNEDSIEIGGICRLRSNWATTPDHKNSYQHETETYFNKRMAQKIDQQLHTQWLGVPSNQDFSRSMTALPKGNRVCDLAPHIFSRILWVTMSGKCDEKGNHIQQNGLWIKWFLWSWLYTQAFDGNDDDDGHSSTNKEHAYSFGFWEWEKDTLRGCIWLINSNECLPIRPIKLK